MVIPCLEAGRTGARDYRRAKLALMQFYNILPEALVAFASLPRVHYLQQAVVSN